MASNLQVEGLGGAIVDRMIRRSVRRSFRGVYWAPPATPIPSPAILVPNHHGWFDGYVMYHAVCALELRSLLWVEEFDAFPLFGKAGAMPFSHGAAIRAATIRRTVRLMKEQARSLVIFAEGALHAPPGMLPFGKALEFVASQVPGAPVIPVAIRYDMSIHERPSCHLAFGKPMEPGKELAARTRLEVGHLLDELTARIRLERDPFELLAKGTLDVNERMDMRSLVRLRLRRTE